MYSVAFTGLYVSCLHKTLIIKVGNLWKIKYTTFCSFDFVCIIDTILLCCTETTCVPSSQLATWTGGTHWRIANYLFQWWVLLAKWQHNASALSNSSSIANRIIQILLQSVLWQFFCAKYNGYRNGNRFCLLKALNWPF